MRIVQILEGDDLSRWDEIQNEFPSSIQFSEALINATAKEVQRILVTLKGSKQSITPQEVDRYITDAFDQLRMEVLDRVQ